MHPITNIPIISICPSICQETPSDSKPLNYTKIKWPGNIHLDTSILILSPYIYLYHQNINIKIPISNRTVSTHIKKHPEVNVPNSSGEHMVALGSRQMVTSKY